MTQSDRYLTLHTKEASLVLDAPIGSRPRVLYWGRRLNQSEASPLDLMLTRQHAPGSPDQEVCASLLNELGSGFAGTSGFSAHRDGRDWASVFRVTETRSSSPQHIELVCEDATTKIIARHTFRASPDRDVIICHTEIENIGATALTLDHCASICLPLDPRFTQVTGFSGRWAGEFERETIPPFQGAYVRENKSGRTSHHSFPALLAGLPNTSEQSGACYGFHLGWSGNHRLSVERLSDGRAVIALAEHFFPGEMILAPGETYHAPFVHIGYSSNGYSALSQEFHAHVRDHVMDGRIKAKPRPVHYNTWEAVYFRHDRDKLFKLADAAARVGAERFILDDGWFAGRRSDKAGLGDWWPSKDVYPNGLSPLIDHVTGLGMEFGLWFEPEMVNPDSELFRNHPDWVLRVEGVDQVLSRNQLVLDLTREEVCTYLYERLNTLLSEHNIRYIKWDMNRDLQHPGCDGRAVVHHQTRAVYTLIDRLRAAHPTVEIESCASGGGRADYGILQRTDRIWTSDSNDALDRQRIQRGATQFFPLEILGAHVGPETCHITGRRLSMEMRVATAMFGHMGMELNLLKESDADLDTLKAGIALHKKYRSLIHSGDFHRLATPAESNAISVVARDQTEALVSWAFLASNPRTLPGRLHVPGLNPEQHYLVRIVWPQSVKSISTPSVIDALALSDQGSVLSGEALQHVGLQLPLMLPETCLIFHLEVT